MLNLEQSLHKLLIKWQLEAARATKLTGDAYKANKFRESYQYEGKAEAYRWCAADLDDLLIQLKEERTSV